MTKNSAMSILEANNFLTATHSVLVAILIVSIGSTALAAEPNNGKDGWIVSEKHLPLPADASEALVESLATVSEVNIEKARNDYPKTDEEWIASVEQVDAMIGGIARQLAESREVIIEEGKIDGVNIHWVTPKSIAPVHEDHLFLFTHGGAYTSGYGYSSLLEAIAIADGASIRVLSVDYKMPPKHPFPAGLNEVVAVYKHVLKDRDAASIGFGGTSAGGGLALASIHKFKELGLSVPGALFAGTPWADLTKTGDSYFLNEGVDRVLVTFDGRLRAAAAIYAGDVDPRNPLISPVYGDFVDFPPTYLVSGTRDLFLSNTVRVHRKLRRAGVDADLNVYEGISHGEYFVMPDIPEAIEIYRELGEFLKQHLE